MANPNESSFVTRDDLVTALVEFAKELKKPDPVEAIRQQQALQKMAEDKARADEHRAQMIQMATEEITVRKQAQDNCSHLREDMTPAIVGQVHSDNFIQPICLRCSKMFNKIPATQEHVSSGVQFRRVPVN